MAYTRKKVFVFLFLVLYHLNIFISKKIDTKLRIFKNNYLLVNIENNDMNKVRTAVWQGYWAGDFGKWKT
jgi:hypothetical protein